MKPNLAVKEAIFWATWYTYADEEWYKNNTSQENTPQILSLFIKHRMFNFSYGFGLGYGQI